MSAAEEFRFKPAALRAEQVYRLEGSTLERLGSSGEVAERLDLTRLTSAGYVEHGMRKALMRRLDLGADGRRWSLSVTSTLAEWTSDPQATAHHALLLALLDRLAEIAPEQQITIGEGGTSRWVMFAIGVASLIGGLGLGIGALASGINTDRLVGAALPVLALVAFGGLVSYGNRPWRALPSIGAGGLAALLRAMAEQPERGRLG